jgi:hypothetical protein
VKVASSTGGMPSKPVHWSKIEESGISSVEIKFIDIRRNTKSEGSFLGLY